MKKFTTLAAVAGLLSLGLTACQDDDVDTIILSPVAGDFTGSEACPPTGTPAASAYQVHVYNQSDAGNGKVFIENIYDIHGKYEAVVSGNTITLAPTPYEYVSGATTYKGNISATGSVDGSILTLNFTLDGDLADDCRFVGNRDFRNPSEGN